MNLGLDIGSVSVKLAALTDDGSIRFVSYARSAGAPLMALRAGLKELREQTGCTTFDRVVATGSGKTLISTLPGVASTSEILAHATAVATLCPGARTVIEIGGQDSKLIQLDESGDLFDHAFNDVCAAGTGAFLDQQAARLGVAVSDLGSMAATAKNIVSIASRCAVFAKSDMIHHQQEGASPDEIAAGLCFALARNYLANLLHGRAPKKPIVFCGGVAKNAGVRRAFIELLGLSDGDWLLPEHHAVMGAIGAALTAQRLHARCFLTLRLADLENQLQDRAPQTNRLKALRRSNHQGTPPPAGDPSRGVYLGLDLGSVSTKGVLIDGQGRLVAHEYIATEGRPLVALQRVCATLAPTTHGRGVLGCGVTGSGRQVAALACRADVVKDEITAQLKASLALDPQVDTIIEIGGQDAKLLLVENGKLSDFSLNRVCAAGTGSFLAEQAARLNVQLVDEFSRKAFSSSLPVALGSRCTVFMDSDLIHHQQQGCHGDDLLAGLAFSVAQNYLEHVVEGRTLGTRIWFQGGVAANEAVVAAFEALLGQPVRVHPYHALTGAVGAALLAAEHHRASARPSTFIGFDNARSNATTQYFTCTHCHNSCEVIQVRMDGTRALAFGGGCDRYEEEGRRADIIHHTRFVRAARAALEETITNQPENLPSAGAIGYPRALWNIPLMPFWVGFFNTLGRRLVPSTVSTRELYRRGLAGVLSEQCFGVKLGIGHVRNLIDRHETALDRKGEIDLAAAVDRQIAVDRTIDWIFLPSYASLPPPTGEEHNVLNSTPCTYAQTLPDLARAGFPKARLLSPRLDLGRFPQNSASQRLWRHFGLTLGCTRGEIEQAVAAGFKSLAAFHDRLREIGRQALLETKDQAAVVLIGRSYQLHDPLLSFALPTRIAGCGCTVIPAEVLPVEQIALGEGWTRLYWRACRDNLRTIHWLDDRPHLLPVVVTAFGCGPDSFAGRYLKENRGSKPLLTLELDEHTAEAGLITRLQAYLGNADAATRTAPGQKGFTPLPHHQKVLAGRVVYIPRFAEHAVVLRAAFEREGVEARVLPPIDRAALVLGRAHSWGRECNPFAYLLGNVLSFLSRSDQKFSRARLFLLSTAGPCLLSQFPAGFELALRTLGFADVVVDDAPGAAYRNYFSLPTMIRAWEGMIAVEILNQLRTQCRPFERKNGLVDRAHAESLEDLDDAIVRGTVAACLQRSRERFQGATGPRDPERPQVAVVGDIFTRISPIANADLFRRIEALGCVVRTPPMFSDTLWHDGFGSVLSAVRRGEKKAAIQNALLFAIQTMTALRLQSSRGFGARRWRAPSRLVVVDR